MHFPVPQLSEENLDISTENQIVEAQSIVDNMVPSHYSQAVLSIYVTLLISTRRQIHEAFDRLYKNRKFQGHQTDKKAYDNSLPEIEECNTKSRIEILARKKQVMENTLKLLKYGKHYEINKQMFGQLSNKIQNLENVLNKITQQIHQTSINSVNMLRDNSRANDCKDKCQKIKGCLSPPKTEIRQKVNLYYQSPPTATFYPQYYAQNQKYRNSLNKINHGNNPTPFFPISGHSLQNQTRNPQLLNKSERTADSNQLSKRSKQNINDEQMIKNTPCFQKIKIFSPRPYKTKNKKESH